jgi:hypothetical protein
LPHSINFLSDVADEWRDFSRDDEDNLGLPGNQAGLKADWALIGPSVAAARNIRAALPHPQGIVRGTDGASLPLRSLGI